MAVGLDAFYPLVAPKVPGASDLAIEAAALKAAIRFCKRSLCLQRELASVVTAVDQVAYTLTQANEVIVELLGARLNGQVLTIVTDAQLDGFEKTESVSAPDMILLTGPMTVRLEPPPSVAALPLVVRAAMCPSRTATDLDDAVFEHYADEIANGAAGLLMAEPAKAYSNTALAGDYMTMMEAAIALAKEAVYYQRGRSRPRNRAQWC